MRGLFAFLTLLVTLPLTLVAFLLAFLFHLARLAWVTGLESCAWVLDPYPTLDDEDSREDPDKAPVMFSPRSHAEILEEAARRSAGAERFHVTPAGEAVPADHLHSFSPSAGGGVHCTHCGLVPGLPGSTA